MDALKPRDIAYRKGAAGSTGWVMVQQSDKAIWDALTPPQKAAARHFVRAELAGFEAIQTAPPPSRRAPAVSPAQRARDQAALVRACVIIGGLLVGALILSVVFRPDSSAVATPAPTRVADTTNTIDSVPENGPTVTAAATPEKSPADPAVQAGGSLDYLSLKSEAEDKLKSVLSDDHGVRYKDVQTKLSTLDGGGIVAFCGEVNSRTPMGGYGGYQHFVASRSVAATEATMSAADFGQAWATFCDGGVEGPKVWF